MAFIKMASYKIVQRFQIKLFNENGRNGRSQDNVDLVSASLVDEADVRDKIL